MSDPINPYIAGNPVTGPEMFFGREDVFQFISQTLIGKHRDNVIVLYGQQRAGKTSVLYQLPRHLDARYLCIFVDLHGLTLDSLEGFLWELANHIRRTLRRDYHIDLPLLNRSEFMTDSHHAFEDGFLSCVWSAIGDRHVLLMLDEAMRLQEQVRAGKLGQEIFAYMRHLMQHYERLNFLFSLGSGLEEMEKEYAFLFNVGLYKKISFLDRNAAVALITEPVKDQYELESPAVEQILHTTSGHPYYTQLLCHSLFNRCQQLHTSLAQVRDVDAVLDEVVERGLAVLKHTWEESTPSEKAVIASMAIAMGKQNCPIESKTVGRIWAHHNVSMPKGEMAKAIKGLISRDIIIGQDKYMFTVDLQRLWVQKYRRLDWVREEIVDAVREWPSSATWLSRRKAVVGLAGLGLAATVGSVVWLMHAQVPTPKSLPLGPTPSHPKEPGNLDFSEGLGNWFLAGSNPQDYGYGIDRSVKMSGKVSGYLKSEVAKPDPNGFGTMMQQFTTVKEYLGKRVRMSGYVKAEGVEQWAGLWMRVDGVGQRMLGFDNMDNRPIKGTRDWEKYEIVLDVPNDSVDIAFGILLVGKGQVWLDNIQFEFVGSNVPTTGFVQEEPSNLDFSEGLRYWFLAGSNPHDYDFGISASVTMSGKASGYLKSKVAKPDPNGFGTMMQQFTTVKEYLGKRVRMSGYVKAEGVEQWAGLWMRVDGPDPNKALSFDNMDNRPIKGTRDWEKYEIVLDVPNDSVDIAFGILLSGKGQVWLDNIQFEFVSRNVPATGS